MLLRRRFVICINNVSPLMLTDSRKLSEGLPTETPKDAPDNKTAHLLGIVEAITFKKLNRDSFIYGLECFPENANKGNPMASNIFQKLTLAAATAALPLEASAAETARNVPPAGITDAVHALQIAGGVVYDLIGAPIEHAVNSLLRDKEVRNAENNLMRHVLRGDASSPEANNLYQSREAANKDRVIEITRGAGDILINAGKAVKEWAR